MHLQVLDDASQEYPLKHYLHTPDASAKQSTHDLNLQSHAVLEALRT